MPFESERDGSRGFRFRVVKPDHRTSLSRSRFLRSFLLFLSPPALPLPSTFYSIFVRAFLCSSSYRLFSNRRVMGTAGGDCKLDRDCGVQMRRIPAPILIDNWAIDNNTCDILIPRKICCSISNIYVDKRYIFT